MRSRRLQLLLSEPCFDGVEDGEGPVREVILDDCARLPPRGPNQADRLYRVQVRAALFASPGTPCSAREVADVLGVRESVVRELRPAGLRAYGRSRKAPFGAWVAALHATSPEQSPVYDTPSPRRAPLSRARAHAASPLLQPLGGPKPR